MRRGPIEEKDSREGPDAAGAKRKGRPSMRRGRFRGVALHAAGAAPQT